MIVQELWDINIGWPAFSNVTQKIAPDQLADIKQAVKKKVAVDGTDALSVLARVNAIKAIAD